jgi:hypothetical protein
MKRYLFLAGIIAAAAVAYYVAKKSEIDNFDFSDEMLRQMEA